MNLGPRRSRRRAVSGIIAAVLLFAMLFTAGIGYLLFQSRSSLNSYQANVQGLSSRAQVSQEQLAFGARLAGPNNLLVTVNDTGGFPISVISTFVKDFTGKVISPPGVMTLGVSGTNALGPLNLNVGGTGTFTITAYTYTSGIIYLALITSRGNVFTGQYPLNGSVAVNTIVSSVNTTVTGLGAGGGNSLVIVMVATPVEIFSGEPIVDNVTLYNYSNIPMTAAALHPSVPNWNVTGTASIISQGCTGPYTPPGQRSDPTGTIPGYSGSGTAPHIYFLCTYVAQTGAVGGLVSFSGWAQATQGSTIIVSASVVSNLVQIGGLTNVLTQGAFSANFFFFKYSSCTNAPSSGSYSPKCNTNTPMPPVRVSAMPEGAVISGGSNHYVAFYIQITNNFNTSLPLLQYTFEQFDQSAGGESDWWLVGTNSTMTNGVYYPNYNPGGTGIPTLTRYPSDCATVDANNIPTDHNCIYVNPGQTVTITLAACGFSSASWDWGGSSRGGSFDSGSSGCVSSTPSIGSGGSATAAITVISFEYKGQTLTEDISFQGVAFIS